MAVKRATFVETWAAAIRRLAKDPLPPLTVIAGENAFVKERLLSAAEAQAHGDVEVFAARPGEQPAAALRRLTDQWATGSLFGGGQLIVVRDADSLIKGAGLKQLETILSKSETPPPNRLLLTVTALDGRSKLAKTLKAADGYMSLPVLRDAPPPWHDGGPFLETDLNLWVVAEAKAMGLAVPLSVAAELARRIGNEPGRIAQKLSQLGTLIGERKNISLDDVVGFVPFSSVRLLGLYEDALVVGKVDTALQLVDRMVHEGVYDPFMRLVSGPAVTETVLRGLTSGLARVYEAHERLGSDLVRALSAKPWQRSKSDTASLDEALGRGGRRVFLERDLKRVPLASARGAFDIALDGLRRLRDGRGVSLHAITVRLGRAYQAGSTAR
jgi:DNA polymerase III delta subunit